MWTETFEVRVSPISNEIVKIPAIVSEDGIKIIRGGITPSGKRIIEYICDKGSINIRISNEDASRVAKDTFIINLTNAFFAAEKDGIKIDNIMINKIKRDLEEAIPQWKEITEPNEPSIKYVSFL